MSPTLKIAIASGPETRRRNPLSLGSLSGWGLRETRPGAPGPGDTKRHSARYWSLDHWQAARALRQNRACFINGFNLQNAGSSGGGPGSAAARKAYRFQDQPRLPRDAAGGGGGGDPARPTADRRRRPAFCRPRRPGGKARTHRRPLSGRGTPLRGPGRNVPARTPAPPPAPPPPPTPTPPTPPPPPTPKNMSGPSRLKSSTVRSRSAGKLSPSRRH